MKELRLIGSSRGSLFLFIFSFGLFSGFMGWGNGAARAATVPTVPFVDLNRYLGTWYEIASIPQRFSEGCTCTRADYTLKREGVLRVVNTCRDGSPGGKLRRARGRGYVEDKQTNSKLSVGFFLPFFPFFRGEYWITELAEDYSYAVVSNSQGNSLWILSRTPAMDPRVYDSLVQAAGAYADVASLVRQRQDGCW